MVLICLCTLLFFKAASIYHYAAFTVSLQFLNQSPYCVMQMRMGEVREEIRAKGIGSVDERLGANEHKGVNLSISHGRFILNQFNFYHMFCEIKDKKTDWTRCSY